MVKGMLRLPSSGWHSPSLHMLRPPAHKISYMDLPFLSTHRHLRNFAIMSDVNAHIIQPLKKFAKDSTHLVKKCTKPDRKGKPNICLAVVVLSLLARLPPHFFTQTFIVPPEPFCRVCPDSLCHKRGVPHHGFYRLLRQAHPHPDQQHFAGRHLDHTQHAASNCKGRVWEAGWGGGIKG